jgi:hypothetical protein
MAQSHKKCLVVVFDIMVGNTAWPAKVGRKVPANTKVSCKISLPMYRDNTWGFVQTSQKISGQWRYSVAFPPEPKERKTWTLVTGISPFQLRPIGWGLPATGSSEPSTAQVADANWTGSTPPRVFSDLLPSARRSLLFHAVTSGLVSEKNIEENSNQPSAFTPACQSACATDCTVDGIARVHRQTPAQSKGKLLCDTKVAQKPGTVVNMSTDKRYCPHNKRKTLCVECKGGSMCKHGKQKSWCKTCGGNALCVHGKQKSRCAVCGGNGLCQHLRVRGKCKQCCRQ